MTTKLETTLKREIEVNGHAITLAISPVGIKLTAKGKRNGREVSWVELIGTDGVVIGASDSPSA